MRRSIATALTLFPSAGRSTVKRASTKYWVIAMLPLSRISCPGRGMNTSPPDVFGIGERAWVRADSLKRLAMRSLSAMALASVSYVSSGKPAFLWGTLTRMAVWPILSFWMSSKISSMSSRTKLFWRPLYFWNGLPSAFLRVLRRISSDAMGIAPQRNLLYLSRSLQILSYSSLVRSPASRNVLANSFAALVEMRDAFAMTEARNDDALEGSILDADRISFMSYLNGASLWVLSIDCFFVDSLVLTGLFFFAPCLSV